MNTQENSQAENTKSVEQLQREMNEPFDASQHPKTETVEEAAAKQFPIPDDYAEIDKYVEHSKRHGFIRGFNYAQQQPEPETALDETRDSLSELIRSLSQINNGTPGIAEYHVKRLNKAKQVLAKYADPNQPRIVKSSDQEKKGLVSKLEELSDEITNIRVKATDITRDRMLYDLDIKICNLIDELQKPKA